MHNAADIANGGEHKGVLYGMNGILIDNVIGDVREQLMDPDSMDFRPRPGSLYIQNNVGPYNYQETKTSYWIPGRRQYKVILRFSSYGRIRCYHLFTSGVFILVKKKHGVNTTSICLEARSTPSPPISPCAVLIKLVLKCPGMYALRSCTMRNYYAL